MTPESLAAVVLRDLGIFSVLAFVLVVTLRPLVQSWIQRRIEAGVEEGLKKRLAAFQLDLDKELEKHRAALGLEADRLRSALERQSIDYGIYAAKRHEATARLFEEFLRFEILVTDMSDFNIPDPSTMTPRRFGEVITRIDPEGHHSQEATDLYERGDFATLTALIERIATETRRARVIQARDGAYEAYLRNALYLAAATDAAAREVRDHFHMLLLPFVSPDERAGLQMHENKTKLRFLMLELQNAARADLGRADQPDERRERGALPNPRLQLPGP